MGESVSSMSSPAPMTVRTFLIVSLLMASPLPPIRVRTSVPGFLGGLGVVTVTVIAARILRGMCAPEPKADRREGTPRAPAADGIESTHRRRPTPVGCPVSKGR